MDRHYKILAVLFALAVVISMQALESRRTDSVHDFARDLCRTSNDHVTQANHQGEVLREFLLAAGEARARSASGETGRQKVIDQTAADRYHELAATIKPVEPPDCAS